MPQPMAARGDKLDSGCDTGDGGQEDSSTQPDGGSGYPAKIQFRPLTWQQRERTEESADAPTSIYAARRGALGGERVDVSACAPHDRQGSPDEAWPHGAGDKIDAGRVIAIPRLFGGRRARSASGSPGPQGHGPSRSAIRLVNTPFMHPTKLAFNACLYVLA